MYVYMCVRFPLANSAKESLWTYHPRYMYIYIYIFGILQALYQTKGKGVADVIKCRRKYEILLASLLVLE